MYIPKIIFSTWKSKTDLGNFTEYVNSVKNKNKDFKYIIYDDYDCDLFVKNYYPQYYKYYKKLELPVQKADLWRYLIVYHYGGWYCDMDIYSYSSFNTIDIPGKYDEELMIVEQEFPGPLKRNFYRNIQYAQYWFAATPKHPVIFNIIERVIYNIKSEKYSKDLGDEYTLYLTGPVPFTDEILENKKENVYIIDSNIWDTLSHSFYNISSFFSDYKNIPVVHRCEGSWRITNYNYNMIIFIIIFIVIFFIFYCLYNFL